MEGIIYTRWNFAFIRAFEAIWKHLNYAKILLRVNYRAYCCPFDWAGQWVWTTLCCLITSLNEILSYFCKGLEITSSHMWGSSVPIYNSLIFKPVTGISALNIPRRFTLIYMLIQRGLAFVIVIRRPSHSLQDPLIKLWHLFGRLHLTVF